MTSEENRMMPMDRKRPEDQPEFIIYQISKLKNYVSIVAFKSVFKSRKIDRLNIDMKFWFIGLYVFREKLELWLPNGIAAPTPIEISKQGGRSLPKPQDRVIKSLSNKLNRNELAHEITNNSAISASKESGIKTERANSIDNRKISSSKKSFTKDLYEPSFDRQESVRQNLRR